ncbi:hook-length control protein FliK [Trichlorobacter thiogenes]|uniref:Hook-length control protein FliK n=1 Tax=Trichlorobacter thiogenes TaxID=115783 RepID=A0A1T4JU34_9BACT|nr:flagellar hook-length control protein FliK [Trichlorobacter thiogenes]SJZ33567.1 hook-length control protein FliK [Trichlorobacter thiogenes]
MDAGQIMMMPTAVTNVSASAVAVTDPVGKQAVSVGLFREMLGQNLLGLLGVGDQCGQGQPQKSETLFGATDSVAVLTKQLIEKEAPLTDLDPTVVNQLAAYAQLAVIQASIPTQQQQQTASITTVEGNELPAIGDVSAVRLNTQLTGDDLAGGLPMVAVAAQSEQAIVQNLTSQLSVSADTTSAQQTTVQDVLQTAQELNVMQNEAQQAVVGRFETVATAKVAATLPPVASSSKLQMATTGVADKPVQQQNISLNAEPEKLVQRNQVSAEQIAQQTTEAQPAAQEVAGAVKTTAAVVPQPVRFAQHPDVMAAAAGSEGQKNTASDQQEQGSQLLAKTPKELVIQGEQIKPELVENAGTTFRLPEPQTVAMHTGQSQVVATDGTTTELVKSVPQELIGRQVTDRLASHEIKQGNDQISLKLSPENLGNLQLNMRMDDNRLKLEIVAENRTVRDALLQQADELKETLARQNIKVDSFNVTTGGNGHQSQQQSMDWRQMTQEQRQYQPHYASVRAKGGAVEGVETTMKYFVPQYQSTLDVRF